MQETETTNTTDPIGLETPDIPAHKQSIPDALNALSSTLQMAEARSSATPTNSSESSALKWAAKLALIPALTGFTMGMGDTQQAEGAQVQEHATALLDFGKEAWKAVEPAFDERKSVSAQHWNDLEAVMLTADNAGVHEVQAMREQIIRHGLTNAEIPARIVHAALYSSVESVEQMRDDKRSLDNDIKQIEQFRKALENVEEATLPAEMVVPAAIQNLLQGDETRNTESLLSKTDDHLQSLQESSSVLANRIDSVGTGVARLAIPYLGKVIVDTESEEGISYRRLVHPDQGEGLSDREGVSVYAPKDFENLASFVIGRVGTKNEIRLVLSELQQTDLASERASLLFNVFLYGGDRPEAGLMVAHLQEKVFRSKEKEDENSRKIEVSGVGTLITDFKGKETEELRKKMAPLKSIHEDLIKQYIQDPFKGTEIEQQTFARALLYLARQKHQAALPAVAQWFTLRQEKTTGVSKDTDSCMLEALGEVANQGREGHELLLRTAATDTDIMEMIIEAPLATTNTPEHRAGLQFLSALRAHPEESAAWLRDVADGQATLLLPAPTTRSERDEQLKLRKSGREEALKMMAYLDTQGTFLDYFHDIIDNPFAGSRSSSDMQLAINGLAMQRDTEAVPLLLKKAVDPNLSESLRELALAAALHIDTPDIIPEQTRQEVGTPFSHANLVCFAPQYNHESGERFAENDISGRITQMMESDPFRGRVLDRYAEWLQRTQQQISSAESSGEFPDEISREQKMNAYMAIERQELGRTGSLFSVLSSDADLNREVAEPLIEYLKLHQDTRRHISIDQARTVLDVLSRGGVTEAQDLVIDIVRNPHHFASADVSDQGGWMLQMHASELQQLKASAIEALGGMVVLADQNDSAAEILHLIARKESSSVFRDAALRGLDRLADRYDDALAQPDIGEAATALSAARRQHGEATAGHLLHHAMGLDTTGQIRLRALDRNFALARVADRLDGTQALALAATEAASEDPDGFRMNSAEETEITLRPDIVRSVMHAMISNGRTTEDISALDLNETQRDAALKLFDFVNNEVYWLGNEEERQYTGKGVDLVVLDAGYVYPLPMLRGMGERLAFPEGLEGYDPVQRLNFESPHPTAVAATAFKKAPEATIHSYNAWGGLREVPFRPEGAQGEVVRALEHVVERQVRGEVDFDAMNYSFSYANFALRSSDFREEMLDFTGAYMELASKLGIKHSVAAGNSRGDSPASVRYGGLGEVNSLGLRFSEERKYEQPDGVFIAGAQDAFAGARLTEFTGSGDPLMPKNDLRIISFDGANVLLPWVEGKWIMTPINGTSFAAPNQQAMMAWADEAFEKANVTPSLDEWRKLFDNSKVEMPHYEGYEGGAYFHVPRFMREITAIIDRHQE